MVDYSKLSHVSDSWTVSKNKQVATAPKALPKEGSVLDNMEVRVKINDSAKDTPLKVMILDDVQIQKIMAAPREEKRKILSRLTDSQRRRVLARFRELQKVKDDESVDKLNLVNLDSILNNCVYSSDDYNMNLLAQWKSAYDVPAEIADFVSAVESLDRQGIEDNLDAYKQFCDNKGIHTQITTLSGAFKDAEGGVGEEDDFVPTEEPAIDLPEGVENESPDEFGDEGSNNEPLEFEDEPSDYDIPDFNDVDEEVADSVKKVAAFDCLKFLAGGISDVWKVVDSSVMALANKFGCRYDAVSGVYSEAWSEQFRSYNQSVIDSNKQFLGKFATRKVMDAIIDEIAEKPLLDPYTGEEVQDEEDKPILEALSEALEAYANGNSELLDQIATTTIGGDSTEEPETEEEAELEEENEDLEAAVEEETGEDVDDVVEENNEESAEDEFIGDSSKLEVECPVEKLEEAAKEEEKSTKELVKELAQLIKSIETGEVKEVKDSLNKHIDMLSAKVPALRKYNFKVSDCAPVICTCEAPMNSINPPLSRSEYYDMCPVCPEYLDLVIGQYPEKQMCPNCSEYQVNENSLCVNPNTCPQTYYPYNCSLDELSAMLGAAQPAEYTGIVNANCCPMSDALKVAALTNNLGFIDNTFYKRRVGDSEWVFDSVPECLKAYTDKPGAIKLVAKATDSTIVLFGQNFEIK